MNILSVLKHEKLHESRISTHVVMDAYMAKEVYDTILDSNLLKGYIQDLKISPYGYSLICELQVNFFLEMIY